MTGAFIILAFTIVIGIILYLGELRWRRRNKVDLTSQPSDTASAEREISPSADDTAADSASADNESEECCGLHLVCEKDSLSPMSAEILYYDDEELDRFIGREADSYSAEEEEEFRDVLMTLRAEDVAGWARSITQRRLNLPPDVRDELLMLVNEQRRS